MNCLIMFVGSTHSTLSFKALHLVTRCADHLSKGTVTPALNKQNLPSDHLQLSWDQNGTGYTPIHGNNVNSNRPRLGSFSSGSGNNGAKSNPNPNHNNNNTVSARSSSSCSSPSRDHNNNPPPSRPSHKAGVSGVSGVSVIGRTATTTLTATNTLGPGPGPGLRRQPSRELLLDCDGVGDDNDIFRLWWPLLLGLSTQVQNCRLQVRLRALETLQNVLCTYGNMFSHKTWAVIFRGILFPMIDFARTDNTKQPVSKVSVNM